MVELGEQVARPAATEVRRSPALWNMARQCREAGRKPQTRWSVFCQLLATSTHAVLFELAEGHRLGWHPVEMMPKKTKLMEPRFPNMFFERKVSLGRLGLESTADAGCVELVFVFSLAVLGIAAAV